MTVETIQDLKELVNEVHGKPYEIVTAWSYVSGYSKKTLFAAYTSFCYCDIHESPTILNPVLIYRSGEWLGKYRFMNKVI